MTCLPGGQVVFAIRQDENYRAAQEVQRRRDEQKSKDALGEPAGQGSHFEQKCRFGSCGKEGGPTQAGQEGKDGAPSRNAAVPRKTASSSHPNPDTVRAVASAETVMATAMVPAVVAVAGTAADGDAGTPSESPPLNLE
jgi:hypothetical protein